MFFSNLIIVPIRNLLEVFFEFFSRNTSKGMAVIGLSFVVTILCLPLYIVAENWQEKERSTQKSLEAGIKRIKAVFKGDEQYMMLSTFYKQKHYHPIMALRSSLAILIQIPFFIAAYTFLSHLEPLKGSSFLFINDLGRPDGALSLGNLRINVLPLAMTAINCVSGALYSKGHSIKEKLQIYITALIFLVLLYGSPSALVVYWTMNNILSLVKNIFYKFKHPQKVLYIIACLFFVLADIWAVRSEEIKYVLFIIPASLFVFCLPLIIKAVDAYNTRVLEPAFQNKNMRFFLFFLASLLLAVTAGLTIPSIIIDSSATDYFYIDSYAFPGVFLLTALTQACGLFLFWPLCLYALFPEKIKNLMAFLYPCIAIIGIIDCFAFSGDYGSLNTDLTFMDESLTFLLPLPLMLLNAALIIAVIFLAHLFLQRKPAVLMYATAILFIASTGIFAKNLVSTKSSFDKYTPPLRIPPKPEFHLSKTGRNVIVFMEDRAVSAFMDDIFKEAPELVKQLSGFTYYPNTVSLSYFTQEGAPGLFGGYEYTPYEMNMRTDKTIREKHNESLLVLPTLFTQAGFDTSVTNLPYENYHLQPQEEIYQNLPNLHRIETRGVYSDWWLQEHNLEKAPVTSYFVKRNMLFFSVFKLVPPFLRIAVYSGQYWLTYNPFNQDTYLIDTYTPLDYLDRIMDTDAAGDTFILFDNELPHAAAFLQAPRYEPVKDVTNFGTSRFSHNSYYHTTIATVLRLGEFFDWLRENDCYDNTRIIIVSDHGNGIETGTFKTNDFSVKKEHIQATLFVKDFNQTEPFHTDMTFMTNADTPALALKDILDAPKNPFTGKNLEVANKADFLKISIGPMENLRIRDRTYFKVAQDQWLTVHDTIFEDQNWSYTFPQD